MHRMRRSIFIAVLVFTHGVCSLASEDVKLTKVEDTKSISVSCDPIELNPMEQGKRVFTTFTLPDTFLVTILISDTLSGVVSELNDAACAPGVFQVEWWFENDSGETVPAGMYVLHLYARSIHSVSLMEFEFSQRFLVVPSSAVEK